MRTPVSEGNGEFKGSTNARLGYIEERLRSIEATVSELKERQDKFLGVIAVGAFAVPLMLRVLFP